MSPAPDLFVIAGEPSGDFLGSQILTALSKKNLRIQGIGGGLMEQAGDFSSLFPYTELSVMGLDVLTHLPQLWRRLRQTTQTLEASPPRVLLTIDSPEFSFRIAQKVNSIHTQKFHCVAPSVWAWRPGRARKIAGFVDHLFALLPFEPPYFTREGLPTTFVGHPFAERPPGDPSIFFHALPALQPERPLLLLLPGSRPREIQTLLPIFQAVAHHARLELPSLQIVLPTLPHLVPMIRDIWGTPEISILPTPSLHPHAFAAATAALAASGTVTLELGLEQTPTIVAYRVAPWLGILLKPFVRTPFVSLPNIALQSPVFQECLQNACTPDHLLTHLMPLLRQDKAFDAQKKALASLRPLFQGPAPFAHTIAEHIQKAVASGATAKD